MKKFDNRDLGLSYEECYVCDEEPDDLILINPTDEFHAVFLCKDCLLKALEMFKNEKN